VLGRYELLEQMAQSMAQMQQLLNSMTPEQRAQIQQLAGQTGGA
jgi:Spy/CpxP family protein refolding chaperone